MLDESRGLRWIDSPASDAHARRGFCSECGSSLFWDPPDRDYVAIAAGSLDGETGLRIAGHWYTSQKGDWYELPDDRTSAGASSRSRRRRSVYALVAHGGGHANAGSPTPESSSRSG